MPASDYNGWNLGQIAAALRSGVPDSIYGAGATFGAVKAHLDTLTGDILGHVRATAGPGTDWAGPAANTLVTIGEGVAAFASNTANMMSGYQHAVDSSATALRDGRSQIDLLAARNAAEQAGLEATLNTPEGKASHPDPDAARAVLNNAADAAARQIIGTVGDAYDATIAVLEPVDPDHHDDKLPSDSQPPPPPPPPLVNKLSVDNNPQNNNQLPAPPWANPFAGIGKLNFAGANGPLPPPPGVTQTGLGLPRIDLAASGGGLPSLASAGLGGRGLTAVPPALGGPPEPDLVRSLPMPSLGGPIDAKNPAIRAGSPDPGARLRSRLDTQHVPALDLGEEDIGLPPLLGGLGAPGSARSKAKAKAKAEAERQAAEEAALLLDSLASPGALRGLANGGSAILLPPDAGRPGFGQLAPRFGPAGMGLPGGMPGMRMFGGLPGMGRAFGLPGMGHGRGFGLPGLADEFEGLEHRGSGNLGRPLPGDLRKQKDGGPDQDKRSHDRITWLDEADETVWGYEVVSTRSRPRDLRVQTTLNEKRSVVAPIDARIGAPVDAPATAGFDEEESHESVR